MVPDGGPGSEQSRYSFAASVPRRRAGAPAGFIPGQVAARQSALAFVADHKVADIVALGEQIYDETMARRIWQGTRELALRHLGAGERVWLVTATPVELASILSSRLGLTGALGTVAET